LCTGALARQTQKAEATLADHPIAEFLKKGMLVTLSTDDPSLFHTDLLTEYSKVASLGLTDAQLVQLAEQSFHAAFLSPEDKRKLLVDFQSAAKTSGLI
jgi:adenosine deaminase